MARTSVGFIVRIVSLVLRPLLSVITPMIAELLETSLGKLLEKARETDNPIDDIFVEFLFRVLDIEIPEGE
jgi:hypothetical protein